MTDWNPIDDEVDDDPSEEEFHQVEEAGEPVEVVPVHPLGVFFRILAGRKIWFHGLSPSQLSALRRLHEVTQRKVEKAERGEVAKIVFDFNNSSLLLIESLILEPRDVDFLRDGLLVGDLDVTEVLGVLWPTRIDEDDDDPTPVEVKKPKAARATKAVANARRTKK